jgi:hypothetical protein
MAISASFIAASVAGATDTPEQIAKDVRSLHLSADPYDNELMPKAPAAPLAKGLFLPNMIHGNGIPNRPVDPGDLRKQRASVHAAIIATLKNAMNADLAGQIGIFGETVKRVNRLKDLSEAEFAAQVILNRSYDLVESIIEVAGPPEQIQNTRRVLANLYRKAFVQAEAVLNNPQYFCSVYRTEVYERPAVASCSEARIGLAFAEAVSSTSAEVNISEQAKAILLVKAMGYLGWDLNMDPVRRADGISDVIVRISDIQNQRDDSLVSNPAEQKAYEVIMKAIEQSGEPDRIYTNTIRVAFKQMRLEAERVIGRLSR